MTTPTKGFQLLSTLPSINHTHHDPDYATSSSHDFCFCITYQVEKKVTFITYQVEKKI